jgi:hypothetical protein
MTVGALYGNIGCVWSSTMSVLRAGWIAWDLTALAWTSEIGAQDMNNNWG